jgi:hypothetical protein
MSLALAKRQAKLLSQRRGGVASAENAAATIEVLSDSSRTGPRGGTKRKEQEVAVKPAAPTADGETKKKQRVWTAQDVAHEAKGSSSDQQSAGEFPLLTQSARSFVFRSWVD